jgi:hypothetical protein
VDECNDDDFLRSGRRVMSTRALPRRPRRGQSVLEARLADFNSTMADVMRVTTDTFNTLADQRVDLAREQREESPRSDG